MQITDLEMNNPSTDLVTALQQRPKITSTFLPRELNSKQTKRGIGPTWIELQDLPTILKKTKIEISAVYNLVMFMFGFFLTDEK